MSIRIVKGRKRYEPLYKDAEPNFLYSEYIEPNLPNIKLKQSQDSENLDYYVFKRYGASPDLPFKSKRSKRRKSYNDLIDPFKKAITPYIKDIKGDVDLISSPEFRLSEQLINSTSGTIIFLHGDVGAGKSTLLKFVREMILDQLLSNEYTAFLIDALTATRVTELNTLSAKDLKMCLIDSFEKELLLPFIEVETDFFREIATINSVAWKSMRDLGFSKYLQLFNRLLRQNKLAELAEAIGDFDKGILESTNRLQYNLVKLNYIRNLRKSKNLEHKNISKKFHKIFLIFDNIDRLDRSAKKTTIDVAKFFAELMKSPVVITLRSRELNRIKNAFARALDEKDNQVFIDMQPPDLSSIVSRRFDMYLGAVKPSIIEYRGIRFVSQKGMNEVLTKLARLLIEEKSKRLLLAIHNGNIRTTTETFLDLLGSPLKILPITRLVKELAADVTDLPFIRDRLPFDYLLEMLALNRKIIVYRPNSLLANIYCLNDKAFHGNNLIKPRILNFLATSFEDTSEEISLNRIIDHITLIYGYDAKMIFEAISQLLDDLIIWSKEGFIKSDEETDWLDNKVKTIQLRTPFFVYNRLRNYLWYICLIKEDTFLPENIANKVSFDDWKKKRSHYNRYCEEITQTINFVEYIREVEMRDISEIAGRDGDKGRSEYMNFYGKGTITEHILEGFMRYFSKKRKLILSNLADKNDYDKLIARIQRIKNTVSDEMGLLFG